MTMLLSADVHLHCSKFDIYAMATVTTELAPLSHVRSFCFLAVLWLGLKLLLTQPLSETESLVVVSGLDMGVSENRGP